MPVFTGGPNPQYSWMAFVDGENLTSRAQELSAKAEISLEESVWYEKDVCVWMRGLRGIHAPDFAFGERQLQRVAVRATYYTSAVGDEGRLASISERLRTIGFDPQVFKKSKQQTKSKGVDISIAKDILSHGYRNNYEVAVLVTGDRDYLPLVEEVKRLGKVVNLWFFENEGLSPELRLAADEFWDITEYFAKAWRRA